MYSSYDKEFYKISYKDLKEVTTDLKKIYSATNEEEGSSELEKFT